MWNIFLPFRACTLLYLTDHPKVFLLEIMYKIVIDPIARVIDLPFFGCPPRLIAMVTTNVR